MNIVLNDKVKVANVSDLRKVYNFMHGYLDGVFETRYTCKVNIEEYDNYFIVTSMDGDYTVNLYRKSSHEPIEGFKVFGTVQEAVSYILSLEGASHGKSAL